MPVASVQGPSSNPAARCDHFEWAVSSTQKKSAQQHAAIKLLI